MLVSKNKNRSSRRLWVYALIGIILTAALYFPAERLRMNHKIQRMNRIYWDAVKEGDFDKASKQLGFDEDEAAEWIERAETVYNEGVRVVQVRSGLYSDDSCPALMIDVTIAYDGEKKTHTNFISTTSQQCNGALFSAIYVPYTSCPFAAPCEESEMMRRARLTFSSRLDVE